MLFPESKERALGQDPWYIHFPLWAPGSPSVEWVVEDELISKRPIPALIVYDSDGIRGYVKMKVEDRHDVVDPLQKHAQVFPFLCNHTIYKMTTASSFKWWSPFLQSMSLTVLVICFD